MKLLQREVPAGAASFDASGTLKTPELYSVREEAAVIDGPNTQAKS